MGRSLSRKNLESICHVCPPSSGISLADSLSARPRLEFVICSALTTHIPFWRASPLVPPGQGRRERVRANNTNHFKRQSNQIKAITNHFKPKSKQIKCLFQAQTNRSYARKCGAPFFFLAKTIRGCTLSSPTWYYDIEETCDCLHDYLLFGAIAPLQVSRVPPVVHTGVLFALSRMPL